MKLAIIGANGQLGTDLCEVFSANHKVIELNHADIEITDLDNVRSVLTLTKPDFVFNTAAYNLVADAEKFPAKAFEINGTGVLNLARVCQDLGIRFVHYSTDYVFDGKKQNPYQEDDLPNPLNVYGSSKLVGEYFALNYCEKTFVIRVSGIYGKVPSRSKGGNFITSIVRQAREKHEVRVVNDEILTPTPTLHIAKNSGSLIDTDAFGLYHMSCEGQCSWYEFARVIWETLQLETPLVPVSVRDFPLTVRRPFYSVLENKKLNELRINQMPGWKEALREFLRTFWVK